MNFKAHFAGGLIASAALVVGLTTCGHYLGIDPTPVVLGQTILVTLFFSLFPDLDVQSIPQRWFYRVLFALFLYLAYIEKFKLATLIAMLGILPLMSFHRGWTHRPLSILWFPLLIALLHEYLLSQESFWYSFSLQNIPTYLKTHHWLLLGTATGWGTHLLLDSRWFSKRI